MALDLAVDVCCPHTLLHEVRVISNLATLGGLCVERSKNNAELWLQSAPAVLGRDLDHMAKVA